jgi:hypothetical protein
MALNAGLFWPKNSWFKASGTVIFEFLAPIDAGLERSKLLAQLEKDTEEATQSLMDEALEKTPGEKLPLRLGAVFGLSLVPLLFGVYSLVWFGAAEQIKKEYVAALEDLVDPSIPVQEPVIDGYPGRLHLFVPKETLVTDQGSVTLHDFHARAWPVPALPISITTGSIEVKNFKWENPLHFDSLSARLSYARDILDIRESMLAQGDFTASVSGSADLKQEPFPALDLHIRLDNHASLLQSLAAAKIIETRMALFMGAGLASLANEDGAVELPVHQKGDMLYAGPLPVMKVPAAQDGAPSRRAPPRVSLNPSPASSAPGSDSLPVPSP